MEPVIPAGFYCGSPSGWCVTPPPMVALPPPPPDNNYILAFRLPLLDKMEEIRKSRGRFHRFNHCQYCTRDLIFSSLLKSDSFAMDRPQLLNILEKALPPGSKFACKGHVEQWLGIIDVGCVATVERLPTFRFPGNGIEQTEYFFLQQNLFKIFAHLLEDSCTEVLEEVRSDLVNLLEDLRQNEQTFKILINASQNHFRNSIALGPTSLGSYSSPGLAVRPSYSSKPGPSSSTGHPISPAVALTKSNSPLWLQKVGKTPKSENDLIKACNNATTVSNLTGEAIFKSAQPLCSPYVSSPPFGIITNLLQPAPALAPTHYLSPPVTQNVQNDRTNLTKRQSQKLRRGKKNRETHSNENSSFN